MIFNRGHLLRLVTLFFSVFFAFGVLGVSVATVCAKDSSIADVDSESSETAVKNADMLSSDTLGITSRKGEEAEYILPYPGNVLPGHLLYPFKMLRDRLWLSLTTNTLRKSEMALMLADKRLSTAKALIESGKIDSGIETATKAEKYLEMAVNLRKTASDKGADTLKISERLETAAAKHEQTLLKLKTIVPDGGKSVIDLCIGYARESQRILNIESSSK